LTKDDSTSSVNAVAVVVPIILVALASGLIAWYFFYQRHHNRRSLDLDSRHVSWWGVTGVNRNQDHPLSPPSKIEFQSPWSTINRQSDHSVFAPSVWSAYGGIVINDRPTTLPPPLDGSSIPMRDTTPYDDYRQSSMPYRESDRPETFYGFANALVDYSNPSRPVSMNTGPQ